MPITYTNRKGFTYFLCKGTTKTGKARYYFAREQKGEPVAQIPPGYEIEESVNGIVSLVKARPRLIPAEEAVSVEAALQRHPKGRNYRLAVKHDRIVIYEGSGPDIEGLTPLQLLDFQKRQIIISHFDGVFRCFHEQIAVIRCNFANFLPLSPNENGALTFLQ